MSGYVRIAGRFIGTEKEKRKMERKELSQDYLKQILDYNPDTGILTWRVYRSSNAQKGMRAGTLCGHRYRRINIAGKFYAEHRIIYLWVMGEFPKNQIDHINLIKNDNRWINLRNATQSQNKANVKVRKDNKLGIKGICYDKYVHKYRASIRINNKTQYIGIFNTTREASLAYQQMAKKLFGDFANY